MSIGSNLKRLREFKGLTQTQLAKEVGVTSQMICQIERGTRTLSLPLGKDISAVLDCKLNDLVE